MEKVYNKIEIYVESEDPFNVVHLYEFLYYANLVGKLCPVEDFKPGCNARDLDFTAKTVVDRFHRLRPSELLEIKRGCEQSPILIDQISKNSLIIFSKQISI